MVGLDVSITEPQELTLNDVNVVVEFLDDDKIEVIFVMIIAMITLLSLRHE